MVAVVLSVVAALFWRLKWNVNPTLRGFIMIEIKVNCKGTDYFSLDDLNILQDTKGFKLKELSKDNFEKLKNRIEKKGFWFPFFVWHCKKENKWYYTDGTQRHKILSWMQESGEYKLPDKFPCVEIFAKDKKEAAEAILTQSVNYGKITDDGLYNFLNEYDLMLDFSDLKLDLELPEINMDDLIFDLNADIEGDKSNNAIVPEKDRNIIVRLSFHPGLWLGKREEILGVFNKMNANYKCTIKVEE